jgi:predicted Rossmann fold nucleotide-binding protein DprA/Smf involved in DNA uptake
MTDSNTKEALKQLRAQRKATIEKARKLIKEQNKRISAIKSQLKDEPRTVPEMAAALGMNTADVLITVAALRKYGEVLEDAKDGDYFKYRMAEKSAS